LALVLFLFLLGGDDWCLVCSPSWRW